MSLFLLRDLSSAAPGVYRLVSRARPGPILATITDFGWYAGYINGKWVEDKQTFLLAAGQALAFPAYNGRNWDAFEEMVNDLSWLGLRTCDQSGENSFTGCVLLYDYAHYFAAQQRAEWDIALDILQSAAQRWQRARVPFYVLLRHNRHWNRQVPRLAAGVTEKS